MEMHQVRYFLAVARALNFTRAAEECNVTQPSLTRSIQKLEEELGGLLFRRERALTHLTDLGREMLPHLQRTFDAAQTAKQLARRIGKAQAAPLSLGLAETLRSPQIREVLGELGSTLAGFELTLRTGSSTEMLELAMRGELDLVLVERPAEPPDRLDSWELYRQGYVVVIRSDHALAGQETLQLADLHGAPFIERTREEAAFRALCHASGVEPAYGHQVESDAVVAQLVGAGLGCAVLPYTASFAPPLVARLIVDVDLTRPVILGAIAGRQRSAPVDAFVRAARAREWKPETFEAKA